MDYKERYEQWLIDDFFDETARKELAALTDEKIEDCFYSGLEFSTGS